MGLILKQRLQSAGPDEEEAVTVCQGTGQEEAEEGVGEWKAGIAEGVQAGLLGPPFCRGRAHSVRRPTRTFLSFSPFLSGSISVLFKQ